MKTKIVVVGTSAGGLEALGTLVSGLPGDFAAPIVVVMHIDPTRRSELARLLDQQTELDVVEAEDGQDLSPGRVFIAPADHNVVFEDGRLAVSDRPESERWRPSINRLFLSAGKAFGDRTIAVLLTGRLDDGVKGLIELHEVGATSVVQAPSDAEYPSMPQNAVVRDHPDFIRPLAEIPRLLVELVSETGPVTPR